MKGIEVMYETRDAHSGSERFAVRRFGSWDETGNYTVFYDDVSEDSASIIVPTRSVHWIRVLKSYK